MYEYNILGCVCYNLQTYLLFSYYLVSCYKQINHYLSTNFYSCLIKYYSLLCCAVYWFLSWSKKNYRQLITFLKWRKVQLLNWNWFFFKVSLLRQSQAEFEGFKHEIRRYEEEIEFMNRFNFLPFYFCDLSMIYSAAFWAFLSLLFC